MKDCKIGWVIMKMNYETPGSNKFPIAGKNMLDQIKV